MMRKINFYKRIYLLIFLISLVCIPHGIYAQYIKRQCILSYGTSANATNIAAMQSVGQPFCTIAFLGSNDLVLPGFLQPTAFGVKETKPLNTKSLDVSIYPNPASNSFKIISLEGIENASIDVSDYSGKAIVKNRENHFRSHEINCESWANGFYILTIVDKDGNRNSLKLIISK